jgi:hypothetical protein
MGDEPDDREKPNFAGILGDAESFIAETKKKLDEARASADRSQEFRSNPEGEVSRAEYNDLKPRIGPKV